MTARAHFRKRSHPTCVVPASPRILGRCSVRRFAGPVSTTDAFHRCLLLSLQFLSRLRSTCGSTYRTAPLINRCTWSAASSSLPLTTSARRQHLSRIRAEARDMSQTEHDVAGPADVPEEVVQHPHMIQRQPPCIEVVTPRSPRLSRNRACSDRLIPLRWSNLGVECAKVLVEGHRP